MSTSAEFKPGIYYDYALDPGTINDGVSMTKQAPAAEHDINFIMAGYVVPPPLTNEQLALLGRYGDVSELGDFQGCVNRVQEANELFLALPAKVRDRFGNDPAMLLSAVERADMGDADTAAELVKLGVRPAPSPESESSSPGTVPVGAPAPAAPAAAAAAAPAPKA